MRKKSKHQKHIKRKWKKINKKMNDPKEVLKELLTRPFIKQRTPEWFKLRENRLTASDLCDAIKNPLSLSKRKLKGTTYNSNAIPALKWGTMFETVATSIYEDMKKMKVYEFGLIINEDIKNFGASPDGITEYGRMIEIKCPYKRKIIDGEIPEKYQYQIQGQLAVCRLKDCDYIECEFIEFANYDEYLANVQEYDETDMSFKHGIIAEVKVKNEFKYEYSTNNQTAKNNLDEMNKFLSEGYNRLIYWKLKLINIQKVVFDENKWKNEITDKIENFNKIYMKEKELSKPINLFVDDDD